LRRLPRLHASPTGYLGAADTAAELPPQLWPEHYLTAHEVGELQLTVSRHFCSPRMVSTISTRSSFLSLVHDLGSRSIAVKYRVSYTVSCAQKREKQHAWNVIRLGLFI